MYSGNAVVVNLAMRFPWLVPVAAVVGLTTVIPKLPPIPPTPAPIVVPVVPTVKKPAQPVEALCPPADKLTTAELSKLSSTQRGLLTVRGCIKG